MKLPPLSFAGAVLVLPLVSLAQQSTAPLTRAEVRALTFSKPRRLRTTRPTRRNHISADIQQLKLALQRIIPPRTLPLPASAVREASVVLRDDRGPKTLPFSPFCRHR